MVRCVLRLEFAFSTFLEDWDLHVCVCGCIYIYIYIYMKFSDYAKGLDFLLSDLGDKSWPIIRLEREWEAKAKE